VFDAKNPTDDNTHTIISNGTVTLDTNNVELVDYGGAFGSDIGLTANNLVAEMARLSLEVYGNHLRLKKGVPRENPHDIDKLAVSFQ
jgi:hypothetical protein